MKIIERIQYVLVQLPFFDFTILVYIYFNYYKQIKINIINKLLFSNSITSYNINVIVIIFKLYTNK